MKASAIVFQSPRQLSVQPLELRQALPSDMTRRKAAVCMFHPQGGASLLTYACAGGRWDMAAALVQEHGLPVDLPLPNGCSALHQMCTKGRTEAALFLIRTLGANPHAVDNEGWNALHWACQEGHTELARILVRDFRLDANAVARAALAREIDAAGHRPLQAENREQAVALFRSGWATRF